ncbi:MAG: uroporphyrinogen decarboxylase family protein [Oscillospiraceae bacterium]|nr:uroporphyrinogen decarboxylase family protein [Oscillospiraceae bacterium]
MNITRWFSDIYMSEKKKAFPILSFPCVQLLSLTVADLISDSSLQAKGMKLIAERYDTAAAVGMMDLSVEAQAFGATIKTDEHEVPTVVGSLVTNMADAMALTVGDPYTSRTKTYIDSIQKATEIITDRPVFAGMLGPFSLAARLIGMTEIMIDCFIEPELVTLTLEKATQFLVSYGQAFQKSGAHGIILAEPAAGLLSPDLIERFSTPYVKQICVQLQSEEFGLVYHNCGNTIPLIHSILSISADAYHFGNAINMAEMLSLVPDDCLVMGNIDPATQFRNGTPESIYVNTTELLEECGSYSNFIISSGCDIPPQAPIQNIDSFFAAVKGFYS